MFNETIASIFTKVAKKNTREMFSNQQIAKVNTRKT